MIGLAIKLVIVLFFVDVLRITYFPKKQVAEQEKSIERQDEVVTEDYSNLDLSLEHEDSESIENSSNEIKKDKNQDQVKSKKKNEKVSFEDEPIKNSKNSVYSDIVSINIEYCSNGGYKNNYDEIMKYFLSNFTNVEFKGKNYPISTVKTILSYAIYLIQISMMYLVYAQDHAKANFGHIIPRNLFEVLEKKKLMVSIITLFAGNTINNYIQSSGAFEIYVNGNLLFSKLSGEGKGVVPKAQQLVQMIEDMGITLK